MITYKDNVLRFTFPDVAREIRARFERELQAILPALSQPDQREGLLQELDSRRKSQQLDEIEYACLREEVESLSVDDIEAAVRIAVPNGVATGGPPLAELRIEFQRTLRIPDDGGTYPLPAGTGRFPLLPVDDFAQTAPELWIKHGGVMMPMYQSEALWIRFMSGYPFAVKIAAGKINAVSGEAWSDGLESEPQNYLVAPNQPWLDGFSVGEGLIRQFIAMPLRAGYSVEEQLTGHADVGGIQLQVYPISAEAYYRDEVAPALPSSLRELCDHLFDLRPRFSRMRSIGSFVCEESMGLGAGGKMRQEIYEDPHDVADWDQTQTARCFVHLCNSMAWRQITGTNPPHPPLTAQEYKEAGLPWFDYYRDDLKPLAGSDLLARVKSMAQLGDDQNRQPLTDNSSIAPELVIQYGNTRRPDEIREFSDRPSAPPSRGGSDCEQTP